MVVSINPLYKCNFTCSFCYLSLDDRKDKTTNTTKNIARHLQEISRIEPIEHIDFYGGEISLLSDEYMTELIEDSLVHTNNISVVTNGYLVKDWMMDTRIQLSISFDGTTREKYETVFNNMFTLSRDYNVIGLVSENFNVDEFVSLTNILGDNCLSIELKPYSTSEHNIDINLQDKFDNAVMYIIDASNKVVVNEKNIRKSLSGLYSAYSDKHVYITPSNKVATLQFRNGKEYFEEYDSIFHVKDSYDEVISKACEECEYLGKCITEHYTDIDSPENCSGHYSLMKMYEDRYFPDFVQTSYKYKETIEEYDDIVNDIGFREVDIEDIVAEYGKYFHEGNKTLEYPLKSYIVSTIFASLIERDFGRDRKEVLEFDIFHDTDRFFKTYTDDKNTYDLLFEEFKEHLDTIQRNELDEFSDSVKKIVGYYNKEYLGTNN